MKVRIGVPVYNSTEYLKKLIQTSLLDAFQHDISLALYTHSKNLETWDVIDEHLDHFPIELVDYQKNRGVAKTWNDIQINAFINDGVDVCIICNDDIYFSPGDVDKITRKAVEYRDNYMVSVAGHHELLDEHRVSHGYSCYAINPIALEKIGCFDENFWPAYGEDLDHHRRATLLDLVETNCADTGVTHGGSMTISRDPVLSLANMATQRRNGEYFRLKWDSESIEDGYKYPFNDPTFGLKIEIADRFSPYPGYNRTDIGDISND